MTEVKYDDVGELEHIGCGGLLYPINQKFETGDYFCDSCGKILTIPIWM